MTSARRHEQVLRPEQRGLRVCTSAGAAGSDSPPLPVRFSPPHEHGRACRGSRSGRRPASRERLTCWQSPRWQVSGPPCQCRVVRSSVDARRTRCGGHARRDVAGCPDPKRRLAYRAVSQVPSRPRSGPKLRRYGRWSWPPPSGRAGDGSLGLSKRGE